MKFKIRQMALIFFCLVITVLSVRATSVIVPSDDEMVIGSRAIVRGAVTSINSGFDSQHNAIFTYVNVRVYEVLKGQITSSQIVLKQPGGVAGDRGSMIFGAPEFAVRIELAPPWAVICAAPAPLPYSTPFEVSDDTPVPPSATATSVPPTL